MEGESPEAALDGYKLLQGWTTGTNPAASQSSPKMGWIHTWELASSFYLITFMDMKLSITN